MSNNNKKQIILVVFAATFVAIDGLALGPKPQIPPNSNQYTEDLDDTTWDYYLQTHLPHIYADKLRKLEAREQKKAQESKEIADREREKAWKYNGDEHERVVAAFKEHEKLKAELLSLERKKDKDLDFRETMKDIIKNNHSSQNQLVKDLVRVFEYHPEWFMAYAFAPLLNHSKLGMKGSEKEKSEASAGFLKELFYSGFDKEFHFIDNDEGFCGYHAYFVLRHFPQINHSNIESFLFNYCHSWKGNSLELFISELMKSPILKDFTEPLKDVINEQ